VSAVAIPSSSRSRPLRVQAPRDLLYVGTSAPLGLASLIVLVVLVSVGAGLVVVLFLGVPILLFTLELARWGAIAERERAALVLSGPIPRPPRRRVGGTGIVSRVRARVTDRTAWKDLGYMVLLAPAGILAGVVSIALWAVVLACLAAPAVSVAAPAGSPLGDASAGALAGVCVGGFALAVVTVAITRWLASGLGALAVWLLAPDERAILAARVDTLEATRAAAVESADARLRRLERDLHDGAQHRLAYIAMELDRARGKLEDDPAGASELLGRAHEESKRAMGELRDLVRGIHPSVLTDRGLDAAVSGLAERCPVPVDVDVRLDRRPPTAIETAAYYVIAESLTNIARHSGAQRAAVEVSRAGDLLVIEVRDDGQGGAARNPGSGLEGLAQRVEALDGSVTISSPPGGPTVVRAQLPCES
jgi:signal transduction histidine kinase